MGEAVGEADFATRLVDDNADEEDENELDGGEPKTEEDIISEGFRIPIRQRTEDLKFSRKKGGEGAATQKRAWVVSPGEIRCTSPVM